MAFLGDYNLCGNAIGAGLGSAIDYETQRRKQEECYRQQALAAANSIPSNPLADWINHCNQQSQPQEQQPNRKLLLLCN